MAYLTVEASIVNKTIESVWLSQDRYNLKFVLADGEAIAWSAIGDCCSYSWFESVESLAFKGEVLSIDNPLNEDIDSYGDYIRVYFITINTQYGRLIVEMRNSSNGYYGGNIVVTNQWSEDIIWQLVE